MGLEGTKHAQNFPNSRKNTKEIFSSWENLQIKILAVKFLSKTFFRKLSCRDILENQKDLNIPKRPFKTLKRLNFNEKLHTTKFWAVELEFEVVFKIFITETPNRAAIYLNLPPKTGQRISES